MPVDAAPTGTCLIARTIAPARGDGLAEAQVDSIKPRSSRRKNFSAN
jgi:hypothetical protein